MAVKLTTTVRLDAEDAEAGRVLHRDVGAHRQDDHRVTTRRGSRGGSLGLGVHIHIDEIGHGPAVLALHGMPTSPRHMARLATPLAAGYRFLIPHLPGYGASPAMPEPYSFEQVNDCLEEELGRRLVTDVAVVGYSAGALRALQLALRGRLRVRCVVALAPVVSLTDEERAAARLSAQMLLSGADLRPLAGPRFLSAHDAATRPDLVEVVERWMTATPPECLAAEIEAMCREVDVLPQLGQLTMPLVARVGELDLACPVPKSRALVDAAPAGRLELVPGVAHALLLEDPAGTVRSVDRLLRSCC